MGELPGKKKRKIKLSFHDKRYNECSNYKIESNKETKETYNVMGIKYNNAKTGQTEQVKQKKDKYE